MRTFRSRPDVELPRPPAVALEILALSRKPTSNLDEIVKLLEREPLLAGRVLKLSNSALYAGSGPCLTLKQALVRMGLSLVRDVVMEAAMQMTIIRAEGFNETLESIRRHSSGIAWISRFVARNTALEAENAFLLGLLHDVGLSFALIGLAQYQRHQKQTPSLSAAAWMAAEAVHEELSGEVLSSWGLPPALSLVAAKHHSLMVNGFAHPQIAVLHVAERIAENAGWNIHPVLERADHVVSPPGCREETDPGQTEHALQALSLDDKHFSMISRDVERVLQTLSAQFEKPAARSAA